MTSEELRALDSLRRIVQAQVATSNISEDDGGEDDREDVVAQIMRRDLPIALSIIDRQTAELTHLRAIAEATGMYRAAIHLQTPPINESMGVAAQRRKLDALLAQEPQP